MLATFLAKTGARGAEIGVMTVIRTGIPLRDVPEKYGPWDRVYDLFRRWQHTPGGR
ncbi:transposase [Streptomyces sp. NPDC058011]|uniref:transposase n=1 Tax=Streptomyces sp. NPDC058011 TaxID=3346305 RepID=UPI0036E27174